MSNLLSSARKIKLLSVDFVLLALLLGYNMLPLKEPLCNVPVSVPGGKDSVYLVHHCGSST